MNKQTIPRIARGLITVAIFLLCCTLLIQNTSSSLLDSILGSTEQTSEQVSEQASELDSGEEYYSDYSSDGSSEDINPDNALQTLGNPAVKRKENSMKRAKVDHDGRAYKYQRIKKHPKLKPFDELIVQNEKLNKTSSFFNPSGVQPRNEYFPQYLEQEELPLFEYIKDLRLSDNNVQNNNQVNDELFPSPPIVTNDGEDHAFNTVVIPLPPNPQGHRYLMSRRTFRPVSLRHRPASAYEVYSVIGLCYADFFPEDIILNEPNFLNGHVDIGSIQDYKEKRAKWFNYQKDEDMPWIPRKPSYPFNIVGNATTVNWRMHCTTPWTLKMDELEPNVKYMQSIRRWYYLGQEDARLLVDPCGQILASCGSVNDKAEHPLMSMRGVNIDEITRGSLPIQTLPACNPTSPPSYDPAHPHNPTTLIDDQYYMHSNREKTHQRIEKNWLILPYHYGKALNFNYTQILLNSLLLSSSSSSSDNTIETINKYKKDEFISNYNVKTNVISLTQQQFTQFNIDYASTNNPMLYTNHSSLTILRHTTPFLLSRGKNDIYEVPVKSRQFNSRKLNVYPDYTGLLYCLKQNNRVDIVESEIHSATNLMLIKVPYDDDGDDSTTKQQQNGDNSSNNDNGDKKQLPRYVYIHIIHYIRNRLYDDSGVLRQYTPLLVFFDALTLQQIGFYDLKYPNDRFDRLCPAEITDLQCSKRRGNRDLRYTHSIWFNQAPLSVNVKDKDDFKKIILPMYNQLSDQFFVSINIDDVVTYHQEINLQYIWKNLNKCKYNPRIFQQTFIEGQSKQTYDDQLGLRDVMHSRRNIKDRIIEQQEKKNKEKEYISSDRQEMNAIIKRRQAKLRQLKEEKEAEQAKLKQ